MLRHYNEINHNRPQLTLLVNNVHPIAIPLLHLTEQRHIKDY